MRFLTGLIIGVILTIGTAYVTDAMRTGSGPEGAGAQKMVNWGVVNDNLRGVSSDVQEAWARIVSGAKDIDKKVENSKT